MSLQPREKRTILAGGVVVVAVIVWRLLLAGPPASVAANEQTIGGALTRIEEHQRLTQSVKKLSEDLGLNVPQTTAAEQEAALRKEIEETAQRNGLKMSSLRKVQSTQDKSAGSLRPVQFRLDLAGPYDSLVTYIHQLEHASSPYIVRELQVENDTQGGGNGGPGGPGGPGRRGGGGDEAPPTGQIKATLKIQSYLFPPAPPAKPEPKAEDKPATPAQPAPAGEPTPPAATDGATTATVTSDKATTATAPTTATQTLTGDAAATRTAATSPTATLDTGATATTTTAMASTTSSLQGGPRP